MKTRLKIMAALFVAAFSLTIGGCKSSDSSSSASTTLSGSIVAAPVDGASVNAYDTSGNLIAGPSTTTSGSFKLAVSEKYLSSNIIIKASGGSYTDEATGESVTLPSNGLSVFAKSGDLSTSATSISLSPSTTILEQAVATWSDHHSGVTDKGDAYDAASTAFETAFSYTPDHTVEPLEATKNHGDTASEDGKLAGVRAAGFSQMTKEVLSDQSQQANMLKALGQDLADGTLDGMAGSEQVMLNGTAMPKDMATKFGEAMINFMGSDNNKSGQGLDKMGALPFKKVAYTDNYIVTYVPGTMKPMQGKSMFKLKVTDLEGAAVSSPSINLGAMMYMADKTHATPSVGCSKSDTTTFNCTLYYLMASKMKSGYMGYWKVNAKVTSGSTTETANFYPTVSMAMGGTTKVTLKGITDTMMNMDGNSVSRNYHLFKDTVTASSGTFQIFLAAQESMMSFPAVTTSTVLNSGKSFELTTSTIVVEASTDAGSTWTTMSNEGSGVFKATGLSLTSKTAATIKVRLTINGEQKTTNGTTLVADSASSTYNAVGSFTVTPN